MAANSKAPVVIVAPPRNARYARMAARAVTDRGAPPRTNTPQQEEPPKG
ncbi:MAG: hypothetical protein ACI9MC_001860 [Kiritimatiellia bacterium]|jgi:hypothetical protein